MDLAAPASSSSAATAAAAAESSASSTRDDSHPHPPTSSSLSKMATMTASSETDEEEEDLDYYYSFNEDAEVDGGGSLFNNNEDPEFTPFDCLSMTEAEKYLQELVESASAVLKVPTPDAKLLLHHHNWSVNEVLGSVKKPPRPPVISEVVPGSSTSSPNVFCDVCATLKSKEKFSALSCGHFFCMTCWEHYFELQIEQGSSTNLSCMSINCDTTATESFVLRHIRNSNSLREKYLTSAFHDYIRSHPQLRFCPGRNCKLVIRTAKLLAKRCVCSSCKIVFCFQCGSDYHAPTDCETIKRWLTKCADDSETANYISAHTKDCPKCNICIEKNGGCNHMQCYNCKHDFCWMCLGDWKTHGSEYYECSRYKENPNIAHESAHAQAREALKKYLHYFERWENHSKSMKLEAQTLDKIKNRITQKVMEGSGTWIDWQYLLDASSLLAKCRYTLQYTYPYAYYMEPSPRKDLFEYQQAQLEAEIENLSWKIEHAESTDRGDLENQIDIAEKRRTSLLKDFLPS